MSKTFDEGREEIARLCDYFATNREKFAGAGVKEAHVRESLIDPFFRALGWDVGNSGMTAPQYREVIVEDSLDVEGAQKAPDYAFRVGTLPKFYVEAKKCGVNIGADPAPAYQLRRYGWSGKTAVSILTDFEELAVYDCTKRPRPNDKASQGRILYLRFDEFPQRWRELWDVFSREAMWSGKFDQFAASKRKRGTSEVDTEFLREIEGWREELAKNIALRNRDLSPDDLNTAVQQTIDRVVFLRMAEDRGIEPYEQLLKLCERPDIYSRFMGDLCRKADDKYNSGLFHFRKEEGVLDAPDRITPGLAVDDKVFKAILQSLYFAHGSPYHFGVMPVEILGTVYERFLGKVIRLTAGHQAKVEEKPEVRKAGGVYYTPSYIVDYIVQQTVGVQIGKRSPAQIAGGNGKPALRVLDMACGSGSFLLGAYQHLLDYCLGWYVAHTPEKHKKAVFKEARTGQWRLTIDEKKRILTTHIFGVDIDAQAVEVSKLSLLIKALEGEDAASLAQQMELFPETKRALPNLFDNIKCGNSLVGPELFKSYIVSTPAEAKLINAFDWQKSFPAPMNGGGFDCVIGNPPYGRIFADSLRPYLESRYSLYVSMPDAYITFLQRAHQLMRKKASLGYIIPSAWLGGPGYLDLRAYLLQGSIQSLIQLPFDVFKDAYVDTVILTSSNVKANAEHLVSAYEYPKKEPISLIDTDALPLVSIKQSAWLSTHDNKFVLDSGILKILDRLMGGSYGSLGEAVEIKRGVLFDKDLLTTRKSGPDSHPYFEGDVYRYSMNWRADKWIEFGPNMQERPKEFRWFEGSRLLVRRLVNRQQRLMAAWTESTVITNKNLYVLKMIRPEAWQYVLGLLNSRLYSRLYLARVSGASKDDFPQVTIKDLAALPYRSLDMKNKGDKARHDEMVSLVNTMLSFQELLSKAKSRSEIETIQHQIEVTDHSIDRLVYTLYGMAKDDIAVVETLEQA